MAIFDIETWGPKSNPKDSIQKIIDCLISLRDNGIAIPGLHASKHASSGEDPLIAADIGAETPIGAQTKADLAQSNAITTAASDATTKSESVRTELNTHVDNTDNPHIVTSEQVNTYNKLTIDNKVTTAVTGMTTYVDTQIANLVGSSPETMNTLNELANALGDDPNFATTMSNQIGSKETPAGAQLKADTALASANSYTDTQIATRETPAGAQSKADAAKTSAIQEATTQIGAVQTILTSHTGDTNNPHATTAAQLDAYTRSEVDTNILNSINGIFGTPPIELNTLSKISTAIDNDPNFATTVSDRIGAIEQEVHSSMSPMVASIIFGGG
jgi:hypothetical protein